MNDSMTTEERLIRDLIDKIKEGAPEPSPSLYARIRLRLEESKKSGWKRPWMKWIAAPALVLLLIAGFLLGPMTQGTSNREETTISLADLEEYALSHPDMLYGYMFEPSEQNAYALYVSLYEYAQDNSLGKDVSEIYEHYRYLMSNREFFL
jgi:hypothetical protein